MGMIDAKNRVTEHQRFYQAAYKAHTRLWKINPRSNWYMAPYLVALWGGFGATLYAASRKVAGHNTWFSKGVKCRHLWDEPIELPQFASNAGLEECMSLKSYRQ
ncbi:hypothetical protein TrVGV298_011862 [Trichoderma virens]|nr:hypothetical protein TrVGV298_011862 [Trichoderma virens]